MRQHASELRAGCLALSEGGHGYDAAAGRVDNAYRRMRRLDSARHSPADARAAAVELVAALHAATATVTSALRLLDARAPNPRHRLRRVPRATRSVPPDVAAWSAELVRLTRIGVWLRRATLDDPGVHVPATVRVADYAATGPRVPGLGFDIGGADHLADPQIGVDLHAIVDGRGTASYLATSSSRDETPLTGKAA